MTEQNKGNFLKKGATKWIGVIVILILIAVGYVILREPSKIVKLGLIVPLSGENAEWGNEVLKLYTDEVNKFNASHQRKKVELVVVHNEKCKGDKGINAHSYFDDSEVKRITRPDCIESLDYEEIAKQAMIDIEVDFTMEGNYSTK